MSADRREDGGAGREPYRRGLWNTPEHIAMELPKGKTCADCRHCSRCCAIFGHIPEDEVCDWYPSRFSPKPADALLATRSQSHD